jgi:hypothetical protein
MENTTKFAGRTFSQMLTGHPKTTRLHTTIFLTGVASAKPTFTGLTASLVSLTNILDMTKWVAPELN